MGIASFFRNVFRREDSGPESSSGSSRQPSAPRTGGPYWPAYTGYTSLKVATVYRCVQILSDSVANLPMRNLVKRGGVFVEDMNHLSYLLNVQPTPTMAAVDFWRQAVQRVLLDGNAYILPVYDQASVDFDRLVLLGKGTVSHDTINDIYTVNDTVNGIFGAYTEDQMVHLKGMTAYDAKSGVSVITFAALALDIASQGDGETFNRFKNGGNVHGIVSNDTSVKGFGEYQDEELSKSAKDIDDRFQRGERIVSLPGQVDFKQISLSSTDMQFLESRKFTVREICRFFGVHPSFVFDDTSNNYKSAEMANVAFLSTTLNPILRNIENELQRKIWSERMYGRRKLEFDRRSLYACDLDSRVKYQTATIAAGLYTVNEWRKEDNKPPVEGGDRVLVSANLKGIDEVGSMYGNATASQEQKNDNEDEQE
ncbi:MAG: phage portal protein [Bacteroidales bacterium]|nr:phage portal protein [Bacteroidales bacterium]